MSDDTVPTPGGEGAAAADAAVAVAAGGVPSAPSAPVTPSGGPQATGDGAEEELIRGAYTAVADNAPWRQGARWEVVVAQGVILGVVGLVVWLAPGFGAAAVLQLLGVLLLAMALLSVWRLMRGQVGPGRVATVAFRAGVGVSIGLVTVIGTLIVEDRSVGTVALAIVLGIGLVLYGLVAAVAAIARRAGGIPVVALLIAAVTVILGVLLVVNGRNGIDALQGTFVVLGIVMLIVGAVLVGYGLMIRNAQASAAPGDD